MQCYLPLMREYAEKSPVRFKMSSILMRGRKIIGLPSCNQFICHEISSPLTGSIHAEANTITKYFGDDLVFNRKLKKWSLTTTKNGNFNIFIFRMTETCEAGNARPCNMCLKMMQDIGIKKIYYTTGRDNEIICEKVNNMISLHLSAVNIFLLSKSTSCTGLTQKATRRKYSLECLKNSFPNIINKKNLMHFLEWNFYKIFPDYTLVLSKQYIKFYNENNELILSAIVID